MKRLAVNTGLNVETVLTGVMCSTFINAIISANSPKMQSRQRKRSKDFKQ